METDQEGVEEVRRLFGPNVELVVNMAPPQREQEITPGPLLYNKVNEQGLTITDEGGEEQKRFDLGVSHYQCCMARAMGQKNRDDKCANGCDLWLSNCNR